ncbi:MAG TPA: HDIG domain-containing protein [Anaerolineales bacterium]|nr:HDIG domain-containing protein [Anaerolineales bacterium]
MSDTPSRSKPRRSSRTWLTIQALLIGGATVAAAIAILSLPVGTTGDSLALAVGDVTVVDIVAPRSVTYVSQVQTETARAAAAAAVPDVYDPPDSRVTRQQIAHLQHVLDFVSSVRADSFASREQKVADLNAVNSLTIDSILALHLLGLTDNEWSAVRAESVAVIERVMSDRVRADRVEDALNQLPALVSVSLPEDQAELVTVLATPFVAANSFFNEAATFAAREAAREAVTPISQSFVQGQTVISRGRVITEDDLEALAALGLLQSETRWQDIVSNILLALMAVTVFSLYMGRQGRGFFRSPRLMIFVSILFTAALFAAGIVVPGRTVLPFLYPSAAFAMLITVTFGSNVAIVLAVVYAALVGTIAGGRLDVTTYIAVGGIVSALALGRAERINGYFLAGLTAGVANAIVVLIFKLNDPTADAIGIATLIGASFVNGLLSAAATIVGLFALSSVFDIYTSMQLIDLARPNHPLLQFLLRQAPGTYQHSLQVANLAEQAGERIGVDTVLLRVGAMFHDVGKAIHPEYFVENQIEGQNPHDGLLPQVSSQVITEHVPNGLKMAAKHRLPRVIRDCIAEHHGTNLTFFQYQRAVLAANGDESKVDKANFSYPGPKPQTKETALLMLADGVEAKSRSDRPRTEQDIEHIVKYIVDRTLAFNQLDECDLTMHDLKHIRESFVETLRGFFHSRLAYPEERLSVVTDEEVAMRR